MRLQDRLSRRAGQGSRRRAADHRAQLPRQEADLGRPARQCRRGPARAAAARRAARRRHRPDLRARSDQRLSAEGLDARRNGKTSASAIRRRSRRPPRNRWPSTCGPCSNSIARACRRSTTATTSARWRKEEGVADAFDFPGFVPAYIRPLFCRGVGPFRWAALSGDPEDIYKTDAKVKELMPDDTHLHNWLDMARQRINFQGLPARICWVGLGDRHRLGLAFNEMVASGELEGADRDRPRSPRFRLGRLAQSRDRSDAGRLGCGVGLAAAQRAAELRDRARPGCRSITAAASASAIRSTPAWSSSPTARRKPPGASSACCGTIRRPASCATPMPATTSRSSARARRASICRDFVVVFAGFEAQMRTVLESWSPSCRHPPPPSPVARSARPASPSPRSASAARRSATSATASATTMRRRRCGRCGPAADGSTNLAILRLRPR